MTAANILPFALGIAMGIMLPFALHAAGPGGAAAFVALHAAAAAALVLAGRTWLARTGRLPAWARHLPSLRHAAMMICGGAAGFAGLHLAAHGFAA